MGRATLSVLAGLVVWFVVATIGNFVLRASLPEYASAEPTMNFTLTMQVARLLLGGVSSLAAGYAAMALARGAKRPVTALAIVMFLLFLPVHYTLWLQFPLWYHLTFLASLLVFIPLGGVLFRRWRAIT